MLRKIYLHSVKLVLAAVLVFGLILVRFYEEVLFYDPFLSYFRAEYYYLPLPEINFLKLFFGLGFRYFLNSLISIAIIYVLFKDVTIVKFTILLYLLFFVVLMLAFFSSLTLFGEVNKMYLFYIRRFLIQPIFLLLFIPAFYYQKMSSSFLK